MSTRRLRLETAASGSLPNENEETVESTGRLQQNKRELRPRQPLHQLRPNIPATVVDVHTSRSHGSDQATGILGPAIETSAGQHNKQESLATRDSLATGEVQATEHGGSQCQDPASKQQGSRPGPSSGHVAGAARHVSEAGAQGSRPSSLVMDNDYFELTISTTALPKVSPFFVMHYCESHLNMHCTAWQDKRMIQVASDPVMVLACVPDLAARQRLVDQINSTDRLWVAASSIMKRRTLIRGNQSISGDDLAQALVAVGICTVVIVRYGHKCLLGSVARLFDLIVPSAPHVVHYVDWGINIALPADKAAAMMFKAKRNIGAVEGGDPILRATRVIIHPMFIPLSQPWMAGHGSLEICLERPEGATTWMERILIYPRIMHAIKASSSIKFGAMPRTTRGMQTRVGALETMAGEVSSMLGHDQPAADGNSQQEAKCGARIEARVASFGRPDPQNVPGLVAVQTLQHISQLLVRGQAIEASGIDVVMVSAERYFLPLRHALTCVREQRIFTGRLSGDSTHLQHCVMADLQSMFGIYNSELKDMYGKVENVWIPPPASMAHLPPPPMLAEAGDHRNGIPPDFLQLMHAQPAKFATLRNIAGSGFLVPHPRANRMRDVSSRADCRLAPRRTSSSSTDLHRGSGCAPSLPGGHLHQRAGRAQGAAS